MKPQQVFGRLPDDYQKQVLARYCSRCGAECRRLVEGYAHTVCVTCGHRQFVNPSTGVSVLVVDGGHVLLGRRGLETGFGGRWCLPGGHIEFDEDFLTTALRETLEETGVQVEITGLLSVVSGFWQHTDSTFVAFLLARPLHGIPTSNDEMSEVGWFEWNALPEMAFEADVHVIERYFTTRDSGAAIDPRFARLDIDPASRDMPAAERAPR